MKQMKWFFISVFVFASMVHAQSNISVSGSMGLGFINAPTVRDYLIFVIGDESGVNSFQSSLMLTMEANYRMQNAQEIALQLDYLYSSNEYNLAGFNSMYSLSYSIVKPNICYYKVFPGEGFQFRLGGGVGPRFLSVTETIPGFTSEVAYAKTGFGLFTAFDAATALTQEAYVYLNGNLQYDIIGAPEHNGKPLTRSDNGSEVNFNNFSAGVKIGILYKF